MQAQTTNRAVAEICEVRQERPADDLAVSEMRAAITALLFESPADLDLRLLWTSGRTAYFRANRWKTVNNGRTSIRRSEFIRVTRELHGYRVDVEHPLRASA
jgi:hypothetical protein